MITKKTKCPRCGLFTLYSEENPSRPFCSARCKLVDLGKWADESYRVPTPLSTDINPEDFNEISSTAESDEI